jgi:hypothetical protein
VRRYLERDSGLLPPRKKNILNAAMKIGLSLAIPKEGNDEPVILIMHTVDKSSVGWSC